MSFERRRDRKRRRDVPSRSEKLEPLTCVFWDLDGSIHEDLVNDYFSTYQNIKSALESEGYGGKMSIWAYVDKKTLSGTLLSGLADTGIRFPRDLPEGKDARVNRMLYDILAWAVDNPVVSSNSRRANVIVISNNMGKKKEHITSLYHLGLSNYHVLLVQTDVTDASRILRTAKTEWILSSRSDGGKPIEPSPSWDWSKDVDREEVQEWNKIWEAQRWKLRHCECSQPGTTKDDESR